MEFSFATPHLILMKSKKIKGKYQHLQHMRLPLSPVYLCRVVEVKKTTPAGCSFLAQNQSQSGSV